MLEEAKRIKDILEEDYRYLHQHAEVGFALNETKAYVIKRLREMGYSPEACGKAGVVAYAGDRTSPNAFLLRADMDALLIREETELPYACPKGNMHACGHDAHTAMLLGAARLLKNREKELSGCIKFMFQPAEELLTGAKDMLEAGVLDAPDIKGAMMLHVMTGVPFPTGTLIVSSPGISAPAADFFTIHIKGKGCHGSMPHKGADPLTAAAHLIIALQEIHARELSAFDEAALTIGGVEGADSPNVIPDSVILKGSLRAYDEAVRDLLKRRLQEITRGVTGAFRTEGRVTFTSGCPTLINDAVLSDKTAEYLRETYGADMVLRSGDIPGNTGGGSEDFAYISHRVPTVMAALAAGSPEEGYVHPLHHPGMQIDCRVLPYGAAAFATVATRFLYHTIPGEDA